MIRILSIALALMIGGTLALGFTMRSALAAKCGGEGQRACAYTKAIAKGKPKTACPKGAFLDLRKGGECWSCPKGYRRTAAAVTAGNACRRPAYNSHKKAKRHARGKGVLKTACPKGQFYDIGKRYCYSCPKGHRRTATSVTSKKACARPIKARNAKAKRISKALCPKGAFFDAIDGGTCWACPKGFGRGVFSVKSAKACAKPLVKRAVASLKGETVSCKKGLIEIGGLCVKKGDCGKKGQRPCLLVERIPSCNKGLAEDFFRNKCDTPKSFGQVCVDVMEALQKDRSILILERLKKKKDRLIKLASDKSGATKLINDANREIGKVIRRPDVVPFHEEIARLAKFVQDKSKQIKKTFMAPKPFCLDTADQRLAKIKNLKLVPKFSAVKKAGLFDGLIINQAHAAINTDFYYWSVAFTFSKTMKLTKFSLKNELIFETDLKRGKTKIIATNDSVSINVEPSEPKMEPAGLARYRRRQGGQGRGLLLLALATRSEAKRKILCPLNLGTEIALSRRIKYTVPK